MFDTVLEQVVGKPFAELHKKFPEMQSAEVSVMVGYWRKVNAVHRWFVDNVQDGNDNCGDYYVDRDKLAELLDACRTIWEASDLGVPETVENQWGTYEANPKAKVKKALAMQLLPPQSGFFFGDTDLDQWYLLGIKDTIAMLEAILAPDSQFGEGWDFEYHSSW